VFWLPRLFYNNYENKQPAAGDSRAVQTVNDTASSDLL